MMLYCKRLERRQIVATNAAFAADYVQIFFDFSCKISLECVSKIPEYAISGVVASFLRHKARLSAAKPSGFFLELMQNPLWVCELFRLRHTLGSDEGWIWVCYSSQTFNHDGSKACVSKDIPSLWKVERDDSGEWVVVQIREHP